jgi:hypothetical protein
MGQPYPAKGKNCLSRCGLPSIGQSVTWGQGACRTPQHTVCMALCHPTPVTALSLGAALVGVRSSSYRCANEPGGQQVGKSFEAGLSTGRTVCTRWASLVHFAAWASDTLPGYISQVLENLRNSTFWGFSLCGDCAKPLMPTLHQTCRPSKKTHPGAAFLSLDIK